jgi:hypothetical protein
MIVGSVSTEVYRRIEEHVSEHNMNIGAAGSSSPASSHASAGPAISKPDTVPTRETLRVGARVLAAYWDTKREFGGFWLAIIKRIDHDEFTLEWLQAPEDPAFKSRPQDIAVLHSEFRLTGK